MRSGRRTDRSRNSPSETKRPQRRQLKRHHRRQCRRTRRERSVTRASTSMSSLRSAPSASLSPLSLHSTPPLCRTRADQPCARDRLSRSNDRSTFVQPTPHLTCCDALPSLPRGRGSPHTRRRILCTHAHAQYSIVHPVDGWFHRLLRLQIVVDHLVSPDKCFSSPSALPAVTACLWRGWCIALPDRPWTGGTSSSTSSGRMARDSSGRRHIQTGGASPMNHTHSASCRIERRLIAEMVRTRPSRPPALGSSLWRPHRRRSPVGSPVDSRRAPSCRIRADGPQSALVVHPPWRLPVRSSVPTATVVHVAAAPVTVVGYPVDGMTEPLSPPPPYSSDPKMA